MNVPRLEPNEHPLSAAAMDRPPYRGDVRAYMICAAPRSGSTFLCRLLADTGRLGVPHEYFHWEYHAREMMVRLGVLSDFLAPLDVALAERYIPRLVERRTTPNGVFGVKCQFDHFVLLARSGLIETCLPNLRYACIWRRDVLAQAISLVIADQTHQWHSHMPALAEPRYDVEHIDRALAEVLAFESGWRRYFALRGIEPVTLVYEDLVADPATACAAIARLVGIDEELDVVPESADSRRLATEVNAEWAERYRRDRAGAALPSAPLPRRKPDAPAVRPQSPRRRTTAPPVVSVVIPCFNAASMIAGCIESCAAQSHPDLEIILVDNNSTDDGPEVARETARALGVDLAVTSCARQGVGPARNAGFRLSRGDYVQWLDADDGLEPGKIACQVAALEADADADVAFGDWLWRFWKDGSIAKTLEVRETQYDDFLMELLVDNWRPPSSYLVRRGLAERLHAAGLFNPATPFAEDREYFTTAALWGTRFRYAQGGATLYNSWSGQQMTLRIDGRDRVASVVGVFERLKARVAAGEAAARLTDRHRELLARDWGLWRPDGDRFRVARGADGAFAIADANGGNRQVSREVAFVADAVLRRPGASTIELFTLRISVSRPHLRRRHAEIVQILEQFCRWGLLIRVADAPRPESAEP